MKKVSDTLKLDSPVGVNEENQLESIMVKNGFIAAIQFHHSAVSCWEITHFVKLTIKLFFIISIADYKRDSQGSLIFFTFSVRASNNRIVELNVGQIQLVHKSKFSYWRIQLTKKFTIRRWGSTILSPRRLPSYSKCCCTCLYFDQWEWNSNARRSYQTISISTIQN